MTTDAGLKTDRAGRVVLLTLFVAACGGGGVSVTDFSVLAGVPSGSGSPGPASSAGSADATGPSARFSAPFGVAVDTSGTVYVADTGNATIRKVSPAGVVTTLAGSAGQYGSADGLGAAARFGGPYGLAVDASGTLYVADSITIRKVTPAGVVTTLAGSAGQSGSADGLAAAARFGDLNGVAVDASGTVYVADNYTIRKVTPAGVVTTLAGAAGQDGSADGLGAAARFGNPLYGVAVDASGTVYVADTTHNTIRKVTPAGVVTTLAGSAGQSGSADGLGAAARFGYPSGVAVDASGNVYLTDIANRTIRKVTPAGVVSTVVGNAYQSAPFTSSGPNPATFLYPIGVAVSADARTGYVVLPDAVLKWSGRP